MAVTSIPASYYQQFDADFTLDVPGEGYGGWQKTDIEIDVTRTAFVLMHAWDAGTRKAFPGWHRAVEYIPRAQEIAQTVFPPLLSAIRASGMTLFHVVGGGDYYKSYPGYKQALELAGPLDPVLPQVASDPSLDTLRQFRAEHVFTGLENAPDVHRGFARLDFMSEAKPAGDEGIAENGHQLAALCRTHEVNHLIYMGFAINWCLLLSPGGMHEMSRYGVLCSTIREAVTAVENKETARRELAKEIGLWRVALAYGFVFDVEDILTMLHASSGP
jgi:hypothetical protein